ncbi:F0F1 ATP synthase subunit epsilon [Psychrobacter pygoscelis]|uniref:F0F1 ATP synthase subunit epsilon n=1 Tax=Psychrobacter pygoscelis TaxID=2488563 RepID=UPI00103B5D7D|nr:F0F1 ATP synthase subunit epsilon [Psychrobacter pygoscelis]
MATSTLECRVVSAREELYSGSITMLIATGSEGEIGVLPGHTPLITLLKPGPMRVQTADGAEEVIYVSGGVLEVQPKLVTVLADTAMRAHNLDESKIVEARKKAEQMLANQSDSLQTSAALASLAETVAQLETLRKYKNRA